MKRRNLELSGGMMCEGKQSCSVTLFAEDGKSVARMG